MPFPDGWFDTVTFNRNRDLFTLEQLRPYFGRHVAWSLDGTQILADGATSEEVRLRLKELEINPLDVVDDFIHDPDVSYI